MSKKILAVSMAVVIMALIFVGCKKDELITRKISGTEYVLATDDNGNTILDEQNQILVWPTSSDGEFVTVSNGEVATSYVNLENSAIITPEKIITSTYTLNAAEGWYVYQSGYIVKDGFAENECYLKVIYMGQTTDEKNYLTYAEKFYEQNLEYKKQFEDAGYEASVNLDDAVITNREITAKRQRCMIKDESGTVILYTENYYFEYGDELYEINYACSEPKAYDESFNVSEYVKENVSLITLK